MIKIKIIQLPNKNKNNKNEQVNLYPIQQYIEKI